MTWGVTTYLIGLFTIVIPIVIHLWSKKTRKTIPFGTIRFLSEDDTQAIKSLIPSEWFLLILRILMLVILILIMSEPLWKVSGQKKEMVLVDPAYKNHPNFEELKDSLLRHMDVRWFSVGFPIIEDSLIESDLSHWELLKRLQNNTSSITVISPRKLAQYIGTKPTVSSVNWVSLPMDYQTFELGDFKSGSGVVRLLGASDQQSTYFSHNLLSGSSATDSLVVTVAIQAEDAFVELNEFIGVSIEAINEDSPLQIRLTDENNADWLIWLKHEPAPKRRNLLYATTHSDQQLIREVSHKVFAISDFQLETFLTYNFPLRLEQVLGRGKVDTTPYDWRELPESQLPQQVRAADAGPIEITEHLSRWFWILLLFILAVERYLSLKTTAAE